MRGMKDELMRSATCTRCGRHFSKIPADTKYDPLPDPHAGPLETMACFGKLQFTEERQRATA
jgi:hypothetical protein